MNGLRYNKLYLMHKGGFRVVTIIDYGMGNLRSVQKACQKLGYEAVISDCLKKFFVPKP